AHVDLLSQTSPIPEADPEADLYLHGSKRQPDSVTVVWRADVVPGNDQVRRLLLLVPPRAAEAVELPVWTVLRWLQRRRDVLAYLADIAVPEPEDENNGSTSKDRSVFRWKGDDDRSIWILPREIRSGDTIIVPAAYGGLDEFGWNPDAEKVIDVADKAAQLFSGHRFVARLAPGILGDLLSHLPLPTPFPTST